MTPSKIKKLKLLSALNPEKKAEFDLQILREEMKDLKPIPSKDYSEAINQIQQELGLLKILSNSVIEKLGQLPFEDLKKNYQTAIAAIEFRFNKALKELPDHSKEIQELEKKIKKLRNELQQKGGGSIYPSFQEEYPTNQTVVLTSYTFKHPVTYIYIGGQKLSVLAGDYILKGSYSITLTNPDPQNLPINVYF